MAFHDGQMFSTEDQDNDGSPSENCAQKYKGAWWYAMCHESNLNGFYWGGEYSEYATGVGWYAWKGHGYSLKDSEMKIRPNHF